MMFLHGSRTRPFLKWAGGKTNSLPRLIQHFPVSFKRYVEPFVGGGSVFLSLRPGVAASLNDSNEELINAYKVVRESPGELMKRLDRLAARYSEEFFFKVRSSLPSEKVARAARLIFLNKTCFNGLYRTNSKGEFNVSFGKRERCPELYDSENLVEIAERLRKVHLSAGDFEDLIDSCGEGDFVYCDPPYVPVSPTANFSSYTRDGFSFVDHSRLRDAAERAEKRGAVVFVSNSNSEIVRQLYARWQAIPLEAPRCINSRGDKRGPVVELLLVPPRFARRAVIDYSRDLRAMKLA